MSAALDLSQFDGMTIHGVNCPKLPHNGAGHLHAEDDDTPYDVDGVTYCGRCHSFLTKIDIAVPSLIAEVKRLREENAGLKRNRCDNCGAATTGPCPDCGAPQCCPKCCAIDRLTTERDSLRANVERLTREREPEAEGPCQEDDGCPTEGAVLKRQWREHRARIAELERDREALAVALNASRDCLVNIVGNYVMELGESYAQNNGAVAGEFSWFDVRQASAAINSARAAMQANPER